MSELLFQVLDAPIYLSLAFLFGIAAQFKAMDGYSFLRRFVAIFEAKIGILFAVVLVTVLFSPFILNDVVILIMTPVVVRYAKQFRIDAAPLLVAEITFTNIASSVSPLGNPQNILLWEASHLTIAQFVAGAWLPIFASSVIVSLALLPLAMQSGRGREFSVAIGSLRPAAYLVLVMVTIIAGDLVGVEPSLSLGTCFVLGFLFTMRSAAQVFREVDYRSLVTLYLFVGSVTLASYALRPSILPYVQPVADGAQPYSGIFVGLTSNLISNVPATQLILNTAAVAPQVAPRIAVEAGLAGNIGPIASFANILALQMARRAGVPIRKAVALQLVVGLLGYLPALF